MIVFELNYALLVLVATPVQIYLGLTLNSYINKLLMVRLMESRLEPKLVWSIATNLLRAMNLFITDKFAEDHEYADAVAHGIHSIKINDIQVTLLRISP